MFNRLLGVLLIVRGLTPFIVIGLFVLVGVIVIDDLRAATAEPVATIEAEVAAIQAEAALVQANVAALGQEITALVSALQGFSLPEFPDIPDFFTIPALSIPAFTIPVPNLPTLRFCSVDIGVTDLPYPCDIDFDFSNFNVDLPDIPSFDLPSLGIGALDDLLREAFAPIAAVFDQINVTFAVIGELNATLQAIPTHVEEIAAGGQAFVDNVGAVLNEWLTTLIIVAVILAVLAVIYFAVPILDDLRRGWLLLRGQPVS